jgi:6-bladed beta-propeller protein
MKRSILALLCLAGLSAASRVNAQTSAWPVSATPMTVVGAAAASADEELAGVMGARRLKDGRLLVADSNPPQLRLFDAAGRFVTRVGRRGSGPGEFRGRLSMYRTAGDSVVIFDDESMRWTLYSPAAKLVRSWMNAAGEMDHAPIAYRRAIIHPVGSPVAACYRALIDRLPAPRDSAYLEIFPDSADRAWIREEGSPVWTVTTLNGNSVGRVTLPPRFDLLQIGDGFVVGTLRDADGVQRVEVRSVTMPRHRAAPPCASRADSFPRTAPAIVRTLEIDLRNLESAGAAFRADYGHYPATFDSLFHASNFTLSHDDQVHWTAHRGEGWDAIARNIHDARYCRILIGDTSPTWLYRFPFCGP